ncbi:MAG: hypothetical protein JKX85_15905 [Phycisphaeraceae bacterium]|nr:hypothetical protein [Phycisphaeraceae bacterium]
MTHIDEGNTENWVWLAFNRSYSAKRRSDRFVQWIVRNVSRSNMTHVAMYDGEDVLSIHHKKSILWPLSGYDRTAQGRAISHIIEMQTPLPVFLDPKYTGKHKKSITKSLVSYYSRGLIQCDDCVGVTRQILNNAGMNVPRQVVSPIKLYRWAIDHGQEVYHAARHLQDANAQRQQGTAATP